MAASDDPAHSYRTTTTGVTSSANPSPAASAAIFTGTITGSSITASRPVYTGDADDGASTSSVLLQTVN